MKVKTGKKAAELLSQILLWVILLTALVIFVVPFLFMITNSFEEFSYVLPYPPKLLPTRLDFSAYKHILQMDIFPTAVYNSVVNTCLTVLCSFLSPRCWPTALPKWSSRAESCSLRFTCLPS